MALPQPSSQTYSVVTGASQGIGRSLARHLAKRGHNVIFVARRADVLDKLATEITSTYGVEVLCRPCDLSDPEARAALINELRSTEVTILCNDAGTATFGSVVKLPEEKEHLQFQLNANAVHELTLAVLPRMVARGEGAILNVGSAAGNMPIAYNATYAGTKAFVNTFSESLRYELADYGINVTLLAPGPVRPADKPKEEETFLDRMIPSFMWANSDQVAEQSLAALAANKRRIVPGVLGKVLNAVGYLPHAITSPINKITYGALAGDNK